MSDQMSASMVLMSLGKMPHESLPPDELDHTYSFMFLEDVIVDVDRRIFRCNRTCNTIEIRPTLFADVLTVPVSSEKFLVQIFPAIDPTDPPHFPDEEPLPPVIIKGRPGSGLTNETYHWEGESIYEVKISKNDDPPIKTNALSPFKIQYILHSSFEIYALCIISDVPTPFKLQPGFSISFGFSPK